MTATVVIPVYNRANVLPRAIESVLHQTVQDFEIIIIDDGSTDDSREIAEEYSSVDERIKCVSHQTNKGVAAARNTGIEISSGDYVSFLDSDDELKPSFLKKSVQVLSRQQTQVAGVYVTLEYRKEGQFGGHYEVIPELSASNQLSSDIIDVARTGGLTLRRNVIDEVGPFDIRFQNVEDTEYWIRLLQHYRLIGLDEPLYIYYIHSDQKNSNTIQQIKGMEKLLSKHGEVLHSNAYAESLRYLGELYIQNKEFKKAAQVFATAANIEPSVSTYIRSLALQMSPQFYTLTDRMIDILRKSKSKFSQFR